jgi:Acetyltransferase (GNAT) domain
VSTEASRPVEAVAIADGMAVRGIDPLADPRWDAFVESHPHASIYHLAAWRRILGGAYRYRSAALALEDVDGRLHGVLPLEWRSGPITGRRLTSLPIVLQGGPLAARPSQAAALVAAACRLADEHGARLRVHSRTAEYASLLPSGSAAPASPAWVVALPDDVDELRRRWKRPGNLARYLRKGQAAGLSVRETTADADLRAFYAVYLQTVKKHRALPHSIRLFELMRDALAPRGHLQLLVLEQGGAVVGGALNLLWRGTVEALYFGLDDRVMEARPSHTLHWETIRMAMERGMRAVNLGVARRDSSQAGFKAQWGAEPVEQLTFSHPSGHGAAPRVTRAGRLWEGRLGETLWTRTPTRLMWVAGGLTYRYL